jgi:hypothetical protein
LGYVAAVEAMGIWFSTFLGGAGAIRAVHFLQGSSHAALLSGLFLGQLLRHWFFLWDCRRPRFIGVIRQLTRGFSSF